jgi:hypothetical protein
MYNATVIVIVVIVIVVVLSTIHDIIRVSVSASISIG